MEQRGVFISVDGPNGVGKTSLIEATVARLRAENLKVFLTKEVTSNAIGLFIKKTYRDVRGNALALLLAADRAHHLESEVIPALASHEIVITDRYVDSSLVFQQLDGVGIDFVWRINQDFLKPDLSVVVMAPAEVIEARLAERQALDRFEEHFSRQREVTLYQEASDFLKRKGFNVHIVENGETPLDGNARALANQIRVCYQHQCRRFEQRR